MDYLNNILGLHTQQLTAIQMTARAIVIFFTSLLFIRTFGMRIFGKQTAFDILTSFMLGSIMGRAVVTTQPFFGSILAVLVIMLLHKLLAWISYRYKKAGALLKGKNILLMKEGKRITENLARVHITEDDMLEALRTEVHTSSMDDVKEVYLERSGDISIIK